MRENIVYWIWLTELMDVGPVTQRILLEKFKSPEDIYTGSIEELEECKGIGISKATKIYNNKNLSSAIKILEKCKQLNTKILTMDDCEYPIIWEINSKVPILFYYIGDLQNLSNKGFKCFNQKLEYSSEDRESFISKGNEIIDNHNIYIGILNEGVDNLIHSYLVDKGIYTLLVMANAPEICFPSRFSDLYKSVLTNGAILSIYPPTTKLNRFRLPKRNHDVGVMSDLI